MVQPEGFIEKGTENKVCHLRKSIYGLKQATIKWNKALHQSLQEMEFKRTISNPGVYVKYIGKDKIIFMVYIDDALFMGSNLKLIESHMKTFTNQWESRILGDAKEYLGMQITRDRNKQTLRLD
jgi:hypothetical protein